MTDLKPGYYIVERLEDPSRIHVLEVYYKEAQHLYYKGRNSLGYREEGPVLAWVPKYIWTSISQSQYCCIITFWTFLQS